MKFPSKMQVPPAVRVAFFPLRPEAVRSRRVATGGFTLIELLVVIGLIAMMGSLMVPAFDAISRGRGVEKRAWEIAGLLEQARSYAMTKNTYVWVGFRQNGDRYAVAVVASRDGLENLAAANLVSIHRGLNLEQTTLSGSLPAYGNRPDTNAGVTQLTAAQTSDTFTARVGGVPLTFSNTLLVFNPRGEARASQTLDRWVEIGIQPMRGSVADIQNTAAIQVAGLSGQVRIFRP